MHTLRILFGILIYDKWSKCWLIHLQTGRWNNQVNETTRCRRDILRSSLIVCDTPCDSIVSHRELSRGDYVTEASNTSRQRPTYYFFSRKNLLEIFIRIDCTVTKFSRQSSRKTSRNYERISDRKVIFFCNNSVIEAIVLLFNRRNHMHHSSRFIVCLWWFLFTFLQERRTSNLVVININCSLQVYKLINFLLSSPISTSTLNWKRFLLSCRVPSRVVIYVLSKCYVN
jgi:hypothetical protein